jgi:hypothetical protein
MAKYFMIKTNDSLAEALGIEPTPKQVEILPPVPVTEQSLPADALPDQAEDYRLARKTFRSLIDKGNNAIEDLTDLARQSESPRAYEVLSTLMKTVAETTKDLYDLQKKTKDLMKEDKSRPQDEQRINVEKAVFVGSTAELLKKVKNNEDV